MSDGGCAGRSDAPQGHPEKVSGQPTSEGGRKQPGRQEHPVLRRGNSPEGDGGQDDGGQDRHRQGEYEGLRCGQDDQDARSPQEVTRPRQNPTRPTTAAARNRSIAESTISRARKRMSGEVMGGGWMRVEASLVAPARASAEVRDFRELAWWDREDVRLNRVGVKVIPDLNPVDQVIGDVEVDAGPSGERVACGCLPHRGIELKQDALSSPVMDGHAAGEKGMSFRRTHFDGDVALSPL